MTQKMVCDILPSQDASAHLIWNSYLKQYRSFALDLMPILETRSEVKVTVTGKWNVTIRHFDSRLGQVKYFRSTTYAPDLMPILETRSEIKVTVTRKRNRTIRHSKMHSHTKLPSKMHLHTKFGIHTLKNVKDVLQTRILKKRSKVNFTVTRIWYVTLCHPKMHFHTKFGIPTSKNIGDMHQTQSSF